MSRVDRAQPAGSGGLVVTPVAGGVRLRVRVAPGARRDAVLGVHGAALKVAVRAAAERGRATEAVLRLLAVTFGLPAHQVELVAGAASRDKVVELRGLADAELRARLEAVLGASGGPR